MAHAYPPHDVISKRDEVLKAASLETLLRKNAEELNRLETELLDARRRSAEWDLQKAEMQRLNARLAQTNAGAAELMAELEERNRSLRETNLALARANSYSSELIVSIQVKEDEIQKLNRALSSANASSAELVAERELQLEELDRLNRTLKKEITDRKKAEDDAAQLAAQLRKVNTELDRLATLDSLTELLNRRGLDRALDREINRAARKGLQLGILFGDFDNFKAVNERYGHAGGDIALQEGARRLSRTLRVTDSVARIGGDEFLAIVPGVEPAELLELANRVLARFRAAPVDIFEFKVPISISLAAAVLPPNVGTVDTILLYMREGLSKSKNSGKDRVTEIR